MGLGLRRRRRSRAIAGCSKGKKNLWPQMNTDKHRLRQTPRTLLRRRSQRPFRPPEEVSFYEQASDLGCESVEAGSRATACACKRHRVESENSFSCSGQGLAQENVVPLAKR